MNRGLAAGMSFDHKWFKALRLKKGLTQRGLADRAGVSASLVEAIEQGKRIPGLRMAAACAFVLGVRADDFIIWKKPEVIVIPVAPNSKGLCYRCTKSGGCEREAPFTVECSRFSPSLA